MPETTRDPIAARLRDLRDKAGLSLRRLEEKAGVSFVAVHQIETGKSDPSLSTLRKLAAALGVEVGELIG